MSALDELYQEILLDHYKRPRNFGPLPGCDCEADGHNPLCGDRVHVRVKLDGERLADVRFEGSGCAISTASASMMTEAVRGKSKAGVEEQFAKFRALVTGEGTPPTATEVEALGEIAALEGVREFPMRVKCATLAWHTLRAALDQPGASVSTETDERA
jgi:nitrogen fixation NifU-like protein